MRLIYYKIIKDMTTYKRINMGFFKKVFFILCFVSIGLLASAQETPKNRSRATPNKGLEISPVSVNAGEQLKLSQNSNIEAKKAAHQESLRLENEADTQASGDGRNSKRETAVLGRINRYRKTLETELENQ